MVKSLLVVGLASLASIINFAVGSGDQRISLGIIVLIVALYMYEDLKPISTALITGIGVFLTRIFLASFGGRLVADIAFSYSLEILFYLGYGILYEVIVRNDKEKYGNPLILLLMICDFGGNALELLSRYFLMGDNLEFFTLQNLFLAAFIRSAAIWLIITITSNRND